MLRYLGITLLLFSTLGCSSELHHNLSENSANEIIVALESQGISAEKTLDAKNKGFFVVVVPSGANVHALKVLKNNGLPRPEPKGFASFYPSQGLIPSAGEEQVLQNFARSQEIRQSLLTIDEVLDAQVNLVIPKRNRLRLSSEGKAKPRASIVIRHKSLKPPIDENSVKDLVAGSVQNLDPAQVIVVFTPSSMAGKPVTAPKMVAVGPILLSADTKTAFQGVILTLVLVILGLAGLLVFFIVKRRT